MIHKVFSIHDSKSSAYLPPFFLSTVGVALRSIGEVANDRNHEFGKHPEDYTLFELGEFNDQTGLMELHPTPLARAKCIELLTKDQS